MNRVVRLGLICLLVLCPLHVWGQSTGQMKIVAYNIWNGFEGDATRQSRFVEWIKGQSADIIILTELVNFKEKDLLSLGAVCGYSHTALLKEKGYPVGVMSKSPIEVISKQVEGFWHGMLHVKTAGIDVIAAHLSPFEWKFRLKEAQQIVNYIAQCGLKDYLVAGDLNAHSPLDANQLATHDTLLINMQRWDASQAVYRNLRNGRYDYSVISTFLATGMEDAIGRWVHPAEARMTFPAAFLYGWKFEDKRLPLRRERLDYILLSPSLTERCTQAAAYPVEGVSDHYPVSVNLNNTK